MYQTSGEKCKKAHLSIESVAPLVNSATRDQDKTPACDSFIIVHKDNRYHQLQNFCVYLHSN